MPNAFESVSGFISCYVHVAEHCSSVDLPFLEHEIDTNTCFSQTPAVKQKTNQDKEIKVLFSSHLKKKRSIDFNKIILHL